MRSIEMALHDFNKVNLFTQKRGDNYKCSVCGCEGWRTSSAPFVTVTEEQYKKAKHCAFSQKVTQTVSPNTLPKKVLVKEMPYIGIREGIHDVVQCPEEYKENYENDIWVWSDARNEAVRLLPEEIIDSE